MHPQVFIGHVSAILPRRGKFYRFLTISVGIINIWLKRLSK